MNRDNELHPRAETIEWSAHPARENARQTVFACIVIVMIGFAVWAWLWLDGSSVVGSVLAGVTASAALVLALNRFFFPSRFAIDGQGITARYLLKSEAIPWQDVRRFLHDSNGGFLSRRARRSRFDAFQGIHIRWGIEDERELVKEIYGRIESARTQDARAATEPEREEDLGPTPLEPPQLGQNR